MYLERLPCTLQQARCLTLAYVFRHVSVMLETSVVRGPLLFGCLQHLVWGCLYRVDKLHVAPGKEHKTLVGSKAAEYELHRSTKRYHTLQTAHTVSSRTRQKSSAHNPEQLAHTHKQQSARNLSAVLHPCVCVSGFLLVLALYVVTLPPHYHNTSL